jgi:hypothetical protein
VQSASDQWFDEAYYQRYYFDKKTSVVDTEHVNRLGAFVCSYLSYVRVPVRRVLDVGFGWERGSVVDYAAHDPAEPFDLVICQGVLPYLSPPDLKRALANLGRLSRGGLYVEAVAREDYERGVIDEDLTDPRLFRHRADLYRRGLAEHFKELGGGVWLSRRAELPLFELESVG